MTNNKLLSKSTGISTIALMTAGLAMSPVSFSTEVGIAPNSVLAQSNAPGGDEGAAEEFVDGGAGSVSDLDPDVMAILGTSSKELQAEVDDTPNTRAGVFGEYAEAVSRGNLQRASEVLALAANRPITEKLVTELNTAMGVETTLTSSQIADAAFDRQAARKEIYEDIEMHGEFTFNTRSRAFREYEAAMSSGNLDAAAAALARSFERPVTEALVLYVNRDLGVETTLTAKQVASTAAAKQESN